MHLTFGSWITRVALPTLLVFLALALMTTAAVASATSTWESTTRIDVFMAGMGTWFAGVIWGVWVNGRPVRTHAAAAASETE